MTIGRAGDATWTIPDPTRIVSKKHCRIDATPDGFTITDISTNGAFLNEKPIGRETTRKLAHGDLVRMGSIVIAVRIEEKAAEAVLLSDGPFGEMEASAAANPAASPPPLAGGSPLVGGAIAEDWWKEAPPDAGEGRPAAAGPLPDAIVITLVGSFPGLDVATLAQGIDAAGAVIGDKEWRAFHDRLRSYLRERYPENA